MIDRAVFNQRLEICQACVWWKGVCLKGHALQSAAGCPTRKFNPVNAASYSPDKYVEIKDEKSTKCCGKAPEPLKPLTFIEAMAHMRKALTDWQKAGFPILKGKPYSDRLATCKNCPSGFYAWFQCSQCKCVIYSKALLATEHCPANHW